MPDRDHNSDSWKGWIDKEESRSKAMEADRNVSFKEPMKTEIFIWKRVLIVILLLIFGIVTYGVLWHAPK